MVKKDEHHASEVFGFLISLRFQPTTAGSPGSSEAIEAAAQMAVELRHIITGTGRQTWWAQSPWCWAHWWNQEPTLFWLVVDLPPEKYKFVSWDYDIPNIWKNKTCSKPPTINSINISNWQPEMIWECKPICLNHFWASTFCSFSN